MKPMKPDLKVWIIHVHTKWRLCRGARNIRVEPQNGFKFSNQWRRPSPSFSIGLSQLVERLAAPYGGGGVGAGGGRGALHADRFLGIAPSGPIGRSAVRCLTVELLG